MTCELRTALSEYDAYIEPGPVNNPKDKRAYAPSDKCERCGARADQNCGLEATASYYLVQAVRRIVADEPASLSYLREEG